MHMKIVLASLVFTMVSLCGFAQDLKIGIADTEYILSQLPESQSAELALRSFEQELTTQISDSAQYLEKQVQEYQQSASTMTEEARTQKETELKALQQRIQQNQQLVRIELQKKYIELFNPIRDKVRETISKIAEENHFTYVFAKSVGGSLVSLYTQNKEEIDLSDMVLKELGITATNAKSNADSGKNN